MLDLLPSDDSAMNFHDGIRRALPRSDFWRDQKTWLGTRRIVSKSTVKESYESRTLCALAKLLQIPIIMVRIKPLTIDVLTKLIIDAKDGCCEHQELGTHHQHTCGYIMVGAYNKAGECKSNRSQKLPTATTLSIFLSCTICSYPI